MGTVTVEKMKQKVLAALEERYRNGTPAASCSMQEVEDRGFLLKEHAEAVSKVCSRNGYSISFREAGEATLARIREGHPCKGHRIMDKSIKQTAAGWTYNAPADILSAYRGLVGFKTAEDDDSLAGLWIENDNQPTQVPLDAVSGQVDKAYTGDYDMHDLFKFASDEYKRITADTVDESAPIDLFNHWMAQAIDDDRRKAVTAIEDKKQRATVSEYSLIRHGAQTSFMCYLHGVAGSKELLKYMQTQNPEDGEKVPWQDTVMNISRSICMFDKDGQAYILDAPEKIYWYYKTRGLLKQIPFYYFFKDLAGTPGIPVSEYAETLNRYLRNFCGLE